MTPTNYKERIEKMNDLQMSTALITLIEQIEIIRRDAVKLSNKRTETAYCEGKRITCNDILHIIDTLL